MTLDTPASTPPDATMQRARAASLAALGALVLLGLAWELWLAPTGSGTLALKVVPLALAFAGLLRHRMYTYRWLSLLVWLYFFEGVMRAVTEPGIVRVLAILEIALTLVLFASCVRYIRWRLKNAPKSDAEGVGQATT